MQQWLRQLKFKAALNFREIKQETLKKLRLCLIYHIKESKSPSNSSYFNTFVGTGGSIFMNQHAHKIKYV